MHLPDWIPPQLWEWLSPEVALGLSLLSVVLVVISVAGGVLFVRWIPDDYFLWPAARWARRSPQRLMWLLLRQGLGLGLLVAGLLMLALPGQGLLTLLAALCVAEYPGKHTLVVKIVRKPAVQRMLNAVRQRAGQPPLRFPE